MSVRPLVSLLLLAALLGGRAGAAPVPAERELGIAAPPVAAPATDVAVTVTAATRVGGGEQIGFFHGEYSVDDGRTWTGFCYEQNQGPAMTRRLVVHAGAAGSRILVRVRIAFRDGAAGDVDYRGAAIRWTDTWEEWREPPARVARIDVR